MYWIGVEKVLNGKTYAYYLSDGAYIGNGFTSNANPYAHFGYSYQDYLTGYQDSRNCTLAHISWTYDQVRAHANVAVLVLLSLQCLEQRLCRWVLTQTDCCPLRCPQYKGSPSNYLQQQDSTFYSSAAGKNKWVAAACRESGGISARVLQVTPPVLQPQQLSPLAPVQVRLDSQRLHRRAALHVRSAVRQHHLSKLATTSRAASATCHSM